MNKPLTVTREDGVLRIEIGINTLAYAVQMGDLWLPDYYIDDPARFAKEIEMELDREEEDGTTALHRLFDRIAYEAIEGGCEGWSEGNVEKGLEICAPEIVNSSPKETS